jgi:excisionase family DNA binding protein
MKYKLLDGERVNLSTLPKKDLQFLLDLQRRAIDGEDYFELELMVCSSGAYPLKGSPRVTSAVHATVLFRVAEDICFRVGLRQGILRAETEEERSLADEVLSVTEAARMIGISRTAVIKAAHAGRLRGKKIGKTWALLRTSVKRYEVAQHRVRAGRAARSG